MKSVLMDSTVIPLESLEKFSFVKPATVTKTSTKTLSVTATELQENVSSVSTTQPVHNVTNASQDISETLTVHRTDLVKVVHVTPEAQFKPSMEFQFATTFLATAIANRM